MQCIQIQVFGKVQGVWYRKSTQIKAQELGIVGTVENRTDGSVWIEARGTAKQLQDLINWCHQGSPHSMVEKVEQKRIVPKEWSAFSILR